MRRRLIAAVAIALAVVLALWLWPSSRGDRTGDSDSGDSPERSTTSLEESRQARRDGLVSRAPVIIGGRVVEAKSGRPLPGAVVSIMQRRLDWGNRGGPGDASEPRTSIADETGHFRFVGLTAGTYSVAASAAGHAPAAIDKLRVLPGQSRDDLLIELAAGGARLTGTVSDIGGGPIPHAVIQARRIDELTVTALFRAPFAAESDDSGQYALDLAPGRYSIIAHHRDYVQETDSIEMRDGLRTLDITMTPGATIEGIVLRRDDESVVEGALVTHIPLGQTRGFDVTGVSTKPAAVTDADGRFVIRGLQSGAVELRALARGYSSAEPTVVELGIAEPVTDVVIYVDTSYSVSGFVVDARDGETTLEGVVVGAYNFSPGALHASSEPSASDGFFEIHGVKPGSYTIGAVGEERVPSIFGASVEVVDHDVEDVVVSLNPGVTLSGRIEPPAAAQVFLEVDMETLGFGSILQVASAVLVQGRAADDGTFTLRGVGPGKFDLVARTSDGREGVVPVTVADEDQSGLVVVLEDRATIAGIVVDSLGHAIEGVNVVIEPAAKTSRGFSFNSRMSGLGAFTDQSGHFESVGHAAGSHTVVVRENWSQLAWADADGEAALEPLRLTIEDNVDQRDLRLVVESRNEIITGAVIGPDGTPAVDAWVTAARASEGDDRAGDQDGEGRRRRRWRPREAPVLTDETGRFRIERLRPGRYDLSAEWDRGGSFGSVDGVSVGTNATIRLERLGEVHGTLARAGAPVQSYIIEIDGPTRRRIRVSNPEGSYRLGRLEAGSYQLRATSTEGKASATVELDSGQVVERDLTLVALGSIRGVLVDAATGEPLSGIAMLAGEDPGQAFRDAAMNLIAGGGPTTDDEGRFRVGGLGAGEGRLFAVDPDAVGFELVATTTYALSPGQDLDLGTLRGTVTKRVPEGERGTLGIGVTSANWQGRPGGAGDSPPAGLDGDETYLWIDSVDADGPGEAAGARVGDRIVAINGAEVAQIGERIARQMLSERNLRAGTVVRLSVDRAGDQTTLAIECAAAGDSAD